jgi:hypothetical protein
MVRLKITPPFLYREAAVFAALPAAAAPQVYAAQPSGALLADVCRRR